jgi:hypothetical protein
MSKPILGIVLLFAASAPLAAQVQPVPLPPSQVADAPPPPPEAQLSRDVGRAAGSLAVAARQAEANAKVIARRAKLEFKRGFIQGAASAQQPGAPHSAPAAPPPIRYEEEAVDACAAATEDEGASYARLASVRDILSVDRRADGWDVRGTVELRGSYAEPRQAPYRFVCTVRGGDVADVRIRDVTARR